MPAQGCGGSAACGCCPTAELCGVGAGRDGWVLGMWSVLIWVARRGIG